MKTTMTAVALVLALGTSAFAQDVKPSTSQAPATAATTTPAAKPAEVPAKPVLAPDSMQKVGAPATAVTAPVATVAPAVAPKVEAKPATATTAPATSPVKVAAPAVASKLINVNTVSASDLEKLPKIGEARAKQIIAGRPYKSVDDLIAKKVLPQDAFDAVKGLVSVQ